METKKEPPHIKIVNPGKSWSPCRYEATGKYCSVCKKGDPYPGYVCQKCEVVYYCTSIDENPKYCKICRREKNNAPK